MISTDCGVISHLNKLKATLGTVSVRHKRLVSVRHGAGVGNYLPTPEKSSRRWNVLSICKIEFFTTKKSIREMRLCHQFHVLMLLFWISFDGCHEFNCLLQQLGRDLVRNETQQRACDQSRIVNATNTKLSLKLIHRITLLHYVYYFPTVDITFFLFCFSSSSSSSLLLLLFLLLHYNHQYILSWLFPSALLSPPQRLSTFH